jgi:hypothetical protein
MVFMYKNFKTKQRVSIGQGTRAALKLHHKGFQHAKHTMHCPRPQVIRGFTVLPGQWAMGAACSDITFPVCKWLALLTKYFVVLAHPGMSDVIFNPFLPTSPLIL